MDFLCGPVVKNPPAKQVEVRDTDSTPRSRRSPWGGHGNPSSILAWSIPWTENSDRLQSIGLHRVGHN